jgi:hypothetical protein
MAHHVLRRRDARGGKIIRGFHDQQMRKRRSFRRSGEMGVGRDRLVDRCQAAHRRRRADLNSKTAIPTAFPERLNKTDGVFDRCPAAAPGLICVTHLPKEKRRYLRPACDSSGLPQPWGESAGNPPRPSLCCLPAPCGAVAFPRTARASSRSGGRAGCRAQHGRSDRNLLRHTYRAAVNADDERFATPFDDLAAAADWSALKGVPS